MTALGSMVVGRLQAFNGASKVLGAKGLQTPSRIASVLIGFRQKPLSGRDQFVRVDRHSSIPSRAVARSHQ